MRFYEFDEPYYALVKARSKRQAVKEYNKMVADGTYKELKNDIKKVPEFYASAKFSRVQVEGGGLIPFKEVINTLDSDSPEVLIIDGALV